MSIIFEHYKLLKISKLRISDAIRLQTKIDWCLSGETRAPTNYPNNESKMDIFYSLKIYLKLIVRVTK
jgi:hypothetical protein